MEISGSAPVCHMHVDTHSTQYGVTTGRCICPLHLSPYNFAAGFLLLLRGPWHSISKAFYTTPFPQNIGIEMCTWGFSQNRFYLTSPRKQLIAGSCPMVAIQGMHCEPDSQGDGNADIIVYLIYIHEKIGGKPDRVALEILRDIIRGTVEQS